jgi:hypothetical protein
MMGRLTKMATGNLGDDADFVDGSACQGQATVRSFLCLWFDGTSTVVYRLSSIVYRLSSIVYRLSSIVYRLSPIVTVYRVLSIIIIVE